MPLDHRYGPGVTISDSPWLKSLLARIGSPQTNTRDITALVRAAYQHLAAETLSRCFPVLPGRVETRMAASEPRGFYEGPLLCAQTRLVIVAVIRAGVLPAQVCYETACQVLPPENVRLDFLNMARITDEHGSVTGVHFEGSKIGGPVAGSIVLVPDPMGATGGTVARTFEIYRNLYGGPPRRLVTSHLMVTPEAIQRLQSAFPECRIVAGRIDRGLSDPDVLKTPPGTHPDRERGLNDKQYIVPGAGGLGELLTNSWI